MASYKVGPSREGPLLSDLLLFRRRRAVVLQRSAVIDQMVYELSRIADALDRLAIRPLEHTISTVNGFKEEEPRSMPFSMFGRER